VLVAFIITAMISLIIEAARRYNPEDSHLLARFVIFTLL
jgi:hypothetical protein